MLTDFAILITVNLIRKEVFYFKFDLPENLGNQQAKMKTYEAQATSFSRVLVARLDSLAIVESVLIYFLWSRGEILQFGCQFEIAAQNKHFSIRDWQNDSRFVKQWILKSIIKNIKYSGVAKGRCRRDLDLPCDIAK